MEMFEEMQREHAAGQSILALQKKIAPQEGI